MGYIQDIYVDRTVTTHAAGEYLSLSEEEIAALGQLYGIDGDMMNNWFGEGGEAFIDMANVVEKEFNNMNIFTEDVQNALDTTVTNFEEQDKDVADSIEVDAIINVGGAAWA